MNTKIPSPKEQELLSLVVTELSGREVAKLYERETGTRISYGTLYVTFRRLRDRGWVTTREAEEGDGRVRYFQLTAAGASAVEMGRKEYERLAAFGLRKGLA